MARSVFYPPADTRSERFDQTKPGVTFTHGIHKLVLHTEETSGGWPSYSSGAAAPNMSGLPDMRAHVIRWRGHFPADMSARALVNAAGGVLTNTESDGVFQIELAGTCSARMVKTYAAQGKVKNQDYMYWPEAPAWALRELAKVIAWLHVDWGLPLDAVAAELWVDADHGTPHRFTFADWPAVRGVLGHQHVPENEHMDPGSIDVAKMMAFAREDAAPVQSPPTVPIQSPPTVPIQAPQPGQTRTVKVRAGQTLIGIAASVGISLGALLVLNPGIVDPGRIQPGQTVTVPATHPSTVRPTVKPKPKPARKPARRRAAVAVGSAGPLVRIVQRAVHVKADGVFGPVTRAAVVAYQRRHHLVADGVVGPKTWAAIR